MTEVSNIDELLTATNGPRAPEMQEQDLQEPEDSQELETEALSSTDYTDREPKNTEDHENSAETDAESKPEQELDDYGNEKAKPRMYTEEEVNERINKTVRERLARGNNTQQTQQNQPQNQQQGKDFAYDPESSENWEQQLERFVENTVSRMSQKQMQEQMRQQEAEAEMQFRDNFMNGMGRFADFKETVQQQPITDHMTMALRGIKDPSAFIYAASKRHPQELQRISQLKDPYSQIVEIGKLEERMRKTSAVTNAPKPVSRSQDDGVTIPKPKKKEDTIEDLIAKSDAKRQAALNARRTGARR